jgi:hypothetical protein
VELLNQFHAPFFAVHRGCHRKIGLPPHYVCIRGATLVSDMAHYIVRAKPKPDRLDELHQRLRENAFVNLRPFGRALTHSLYEARLQSNGMAVWEEEDYCSPPLAQEREAVLDAYFDEITVERVNAGEGWKRIETLRKLNV